MRRLVCLGLALGLALPAAAQELTELAAQTKPSVALLIVKNAFGKKIGTGTGFFISGDGRMATNFHVIKDASSLTAKLADKRELQVTGVWKASEANDLAILQVESGTYPALPLDDSGVLKVGDPVVAVGSPVGLEGVVSTGIVSAIRPDGLTPDPDDPDPVDMDTSAWRIQVTAPISPGSSGSPILTPQGQVVGVAVGVRTDGQALNFAIPVTLLKEMLASLPGQPSALAATVASARGSNPKLLRNLGISVAFFVILGMIYRRAHR